MRHGAYMRKPARLERVEAGTAAECASRAAQFSVRLRLCQRARGSVPALYPVTSLCCGSGLGFGWRLAVAEELEGHVHFAEVAAAVAGAGSGEEAPVGLFVHVIGVGAIAGVGVTRVGEVEPVWRNLVELGRRERADEAARGFEHCVRVGEDVRGPDSLRDLLGGIGPHANREERRRHAAVAPFLAPDEELEQLRNVLLTKEGAVRANIVTRKFAQKGPEHNQLLRSIAERFLAHEGQLRAARAFEVTKAIVAMALAVVGEYDRFKRLRAALDYDDLILRTRDLLLRGEMAQWVLYKLDNGIDHILVDEAQDTSHDQWQVIRQLADEFFAGKGAHDGQNRTLFAVGDEKQSIFGFQGAAPKEFGVNRTYFLGLARRGGFPFEDAHPPISRRGAVTILKFVDAVFAQDIANKGLTFAKEEIRHEGARDEIGRVEVWATEPVPDDVDVDPWEPVDAPPRRGSHFRLARGIARRIKALIDRPAGVPSTGEAVTPGRIMILVRRRNAFATEMIRQLLEHKVPVAGADRMVLMDQMAIQDLVALGRFALLPEDDLNLAALLKSPFLDLQRRRSVRPRIRARR